VGVAVIAGLMFDATRLPGWVFSHPAHMNVTVLIAAAAVIAKYWLARRSWRDVEPAYVRQYLLVWLAGTTAIGALALVVWNIARIYVAADAERFRTLVILLALLAVPLARVGFASASVARNRHR
jgi:putative copper export protein